jgi:beta-glucanase (GH16 family)
MNRILITCFLLLSALSHAQTWKLVWSDEFDKNGVPDTTKWVFETNTIRNNELQFYTSQRPENCNVQNGNLLIIARKEKVQDANYTSARLSTDGKFNFLYGKIEARLKLPTGKGIWPAFWLLGQNYKEVGSPKCGEIDMVEHVNNETNIHSTMHWYKNGLVSFEASKKCDVQQFHVYTVEWDKRKIQWFLDGKKYHEGKIKKSKDNADEFQHPFYIILNLAIGGNWPGNPDETTTFPDTLKVDYVRVYKKIRN